MHGQQNIKISDDISSSTADNTYNLAILCTICKGEKNVRRKKEEEANSTCFKLNDLHVKKENYVISFRLNNVDNRRL